MMASGSINESKDENVHLHCEPNVPTSSTGKQRNDKRSDFFNDAKGQLLEIFPQIDRTYLKEKLDTLSRLVSGAASQEFLVELTTHDLAENGYPKVSRKDLAEIHNNRVAASASIAPVASKSGTSLESASLSKKVKVSCCKKRTNENVTGGINWLDYKAALAYTGAMPVVDTDYYDIVKLELRNAFPQVLCKDLDSLLRHYETFAPVYLIISHSWVTNFGDIEYTHANRGSKFHIEYANEELDICANIRTTLLKSKPRLARSIAECQWMNIIAQERLCVDRYLNKEELSPQKLVAVGAQASASGDEESDVMECEICYEEVSMDQMIPCPDGHLFCRTCVNKYLEESVYGGNANIKCLEGSCKQTYQLSKLRQCVDEKLLEKYTDRLQEENLNIAQLDNFIRCPKCNYGAILPSDSKVFDCQNPDCMVSTCRYCKEDWEEHCGKPCEEVESKDATHVRRKYEEKMSEAKIRTCVQCKVQLVKSEGCNLMTCRCGAKMCYICRRPIKNYSHFCNHLRDPDVRGCQKCNNCYLWSNVEDDDKRAIKEIQEEAKGMKQELGLDCDKLIGAPSTPEPQQSRKRNNDRLDAVRPAAAVVAPLVPLFANLFQNQAAVQPQNQNYQNQAAVQLQNQNYQNQAAVQLQNQNYQNQAAVQLQNQNYQNPAAVQPQNQHYRNQGAGQQQNQNYQNRAIGQQRNQHYRNQAHQHQGQYYQNQVDQRHNHDNPPRYDEIANIQQPPIPMPRNQPHQGEIPNIQQPQQYPNPAGHEGAQHVLPQMWRRFNLDFLGPRH